MGDASAAAQACQCFKLLNEMCVYADLDLGSLHARAERRVGLAIGCRHCQGNDCPNTGHMHCQATFDRR